MRVAIYTDSTSASNGYGRVTLSVIEALTRRGIDVGVNGNVNGSIVHRDKSIDIAITGPNCPDKRVPRAKLWLTMWEPDKFPPGALKALRRCKRIAVPSQHNVDALAKVRIKAELLPLGVRPAFMFMPNGPLTFMSVSADHGIPQRKRAADIVAAFKKAFPVEADVALIVKQTPDCAQIPNYDTRVTIIRDDLPEQAMLDLYARAHVGVHLSGLEGWGLPPHEFIAHGRPVIAPLWGGVANFLDVTCSFPLEYKLCRAPKRLYGGVGQYAHASEQSLIRAFRWCYENPDDIVLRGAMAYKRARHFSPETFGARLIQLLK